jgi:hypothetical protein
MQSNIKDVGTQLAPCHRPLRGLLNGDSHTRRHTPSLERVPDGVLAETDCICERRLAAKLVDCYLQWNGSHLPYKNTHFCVVVNTVYCRKSCAGCGKHRCVERYWALGIGRRIREERELKGLSQTQLAEMAGCKQADVHRIETGQVIHSKYLTPILKALSILDDPGAVVPVVGYVGAGSEVFAFDDHAKGDGFDHIPAPPGMLNGIALIIRGNSMTPKYDDGEVIFIEKTIVSVDGLIGENCYIEIADGRRYIKRLQYGSRPGLFTLISYNAPPIMDVIVERAYPIAFTKPKYKNLK